MRNRTKEIVWLILVAAILSVGVHRTLSLLPKVVLVYTIVAIVGGTLGWFWRRIYQWIKDE